MLQLVRGGVRGLGEVDQQRALPGAGRNSAFHGAGRDAHAGENPEAGLSQGARDVNRRVGVEQERNRVGVTRLAHNEDARASLLAVELRHPRGASPEANFEPRGSDERGPSFPEE